MSYGRLGQFWATQSATRSPIMMAVALVLARGTWGMTDESATQIPFTPLTLHCWSTTAMGSESGPILQVPGPTPSLYWLQRSPLCRSQGLPCHDLRYLRQANAAREKVPLPYACRSTTTGISRVVLVRYSS